MTSYSYEHSILGATTAAGWQPLTDVLRGHKHPVYIYNTASILRRIAALEKSLSGLDYRAHYAMKCNDNEDVLKLIKKQGLGADVVSRGEAERAMAQGFTGADIIFSGVAKSKDELTFAIQNKIAQINVESLPELERVGMLCAELKHSAAVGLRLNPDIKVDTHPYITTGFRENKFGLPEEQISEAVRIIKKWSPWLELKGLSSHLGSQIRDLSPIADSLKALVTISRSLMDQGFKIETLDIGGGVGIDYHSENEQSEYDMIAAFGETVKAIHRDFPARLLLEPGRWIVGRSGVLCAQVEYVKFNGFKNFLILNTGMNHLLRPSLYKAFHRTLPVEKREAGETKLYDVVGPICESSDVLGHDRLLAGVKEGDWIAIMDAGAYGMSMSSLYNRHQLPTEILI